MEDGDSSENVSSLLIPSSTSSFIIARLFHSYLEKKDSSSRSKLESSLQRESVEDVSLEIPREKFEEINGQLKVMQIA